jgi:hypothetical protein
MSVIVAAFERAAGEAMEGVARRATGVDAARGASI